MVRDNEVAARLSGIDVARTQVLAYVISAACAGLAGSLFAYWVTVTSPSGFTLNLSLSLLTAIVIGGLGSLSGAVLGSFILVYLPVWTGGLASSLNLSSNVANNVPLAIYGIVLIVAILVFPRGIAGGVASILHAGDADASLEPAQRRATLPHPRCLRNDASNRIQHTQGAHACDQRSVDRGPGRWPPREGRQRC